MTAASGLAPGLDGLIALATVGLVWAAGSTWETRSRRQGMLAAAERLHLTMLDPVPGVLSSEGETLTHVETNDLYQPVRQSQYALMGQWKGRDVVCLQFYSSRQGNFTTFVARTSSLPACGLVSRQRLRPLSAALLVPSQPECLLPELRKTHYLTSPLDEAEAGRLLPPALQRWLATRPQWTIVVKSDGWAVMHPNREVGAAEYATALDQAVELLGALEAGTPPG